MPTAREDPTTLFENKDGEKTLSKSMKEKFNTFREKRGLDIVSISDDVVRFATQIFAYKLLRKCGKDEVSAAIIAVAEKCAEGV